jgi:PAS domain S-box-containing protein
MRRDLSEIRRAVASGQETIAETLALIAVADALATPVYYQHPRTIEAATSAPAAIDYPVVKATAGTQDGVLANGRISARAAFERQVLEEQNLTRDAGATLQLQQISTLLIREENNGKLYGRFVDAAIGLMSADMGSMQMFHPQRGELQLLAERGFDRESAAYWEWVRVDSACVCGMALSAGCRAIVPDIEACDTIMGTADLKAFRRSGIRAVQATPLVARSGRLLGMIATQWRKPHRPAESELRSLDVLARLAADLIERNEAEVALRESREQFRWLASIVEFSDDAIVGKSLEGTIQSWNRGAERLFGYSAEEVVGKSITILIPLERQDEEQTILRLIRRGHRIEHYETVRRRKDASLIDISLTVSPVRDEAGKIVGASKIARDITERKRSEKQISILAREAEHRAKNLLANVTAMVQLSQADTPDGLKEAIAGRIGALANVHSLFAKSRWTGADLGRLIRQELSPYCRIGEARAQIDGPTVMLKPELAQAMAVALHELATNAAKYGALSGAKGQVRVEWSCAADQVVLRWIEAGGPPVNPPTHKGFGTQMIEAMIRGHEGGNVRLNWHAEGLACEITLAT